MTKQQLANRLTLALLASLSSLFFAEMPGTSQTKRDEPRANANVRILKFPTDKTIGKVMLDFDPEHRLIKNFTPSRILPARGDVAVEKSKIVTFSADAEFFKHPESLSHLPADAFDCIQLQLITLEDSELNLCDAALPHITHLSGLRTVFLDRSDVTDQGMLHLKPLKNLESISAFMTQVSGSCFKDPSNLTKLTNLNLSSGPVNNSALRYLSNLPALKKLAICRSGITPEGVQNLTSCPKLEVLDISRNPKIDDSCVKYLQKMKHLQTLYIFDTSISLAGLEALKSLKLKCLGTPRSAYSKQEKVSIQASFPGCTIMWHK